MSPPSPSRPLGPGPAGPRLWRVILVVAAGAVPAALLPPLLGGLAYAAAAFAALALEGEL